MIFLTKEQILLLHSDLVAQTGGTDGVRDEGLLDSALGAPFQNFGGVDAYPSLQQKGARLGYGIIKNHPFLDGNKRIGVHAMLVFLELNHIELCYTQQELSDMVLAIASGAMTFEQMAQWVMDHQI